MIDSAGRRCLHADGTVLDLVPVGRAVGLGGGLLVCLFVLVRPEASAGLDAPARAAFWALHVGLGLGALLVASRWLASGRHLPEDTVPAILLTGFAGVAIASPGYLALDALFGPYLLERDPEPSAGGFLASLIGEMIEVAPWFMIAWLLINLPMLLPRPDLDVRLDDAVSSRVVPIAAIASAEPADRSAPLRLVEASTADVHDRPMQVDESAQRFLSTLPGVIGTDIVAVASDLHYLNVWTVAGRTTVFGNLRDVVADLGDAGMQVHRSHWVAHAHVRRIVGTAGDAACILSNELRVPISRRRWKAVREQFGRGVVHVAGPSTANRRS